jgi:allophanate hydrolase
VTTPSNTFPLDLSSLRLAYSEGKATPTDAVDACLAATALQGTEGIWIHLRDAAQLRAEARALEGRFAHGERPPLYGVPFAVKDSIDVAGVPTTVACPDYAYVPEHSAPVIDALCAAGAIFMGKVNLDQFATGLVGVRSPYGIPPNAFDARYVTGGSSSGSAAAVTRGQVSFALATDTAGSGRVPAAFNNVVGFKPSRGLLSATGLVPACRSIDCMTVIALTCEDARAVAQVACGFDSRDPFSRAEARTFSWAGQRPARGARIAIPRPADRVSCDDATERSFSDACVHLEAMGYVLEEVDMTPFFEVGALLYEGPWVSERLAGLEAFVQEHPQSVLPVVRTILAFGDRYRATDAFRGVHRLAELKQAIAPMWESIAALVVPSVPRHPRIDEVLADPIAENARLGKFSTFGNLLDMAGVAVPTGFRQDGLPSGVTLLGPWGRDPQLLALGAELHRAAQVPLGATGWSLPPASESLPAKVPESHLPLAVVGAHLTGQPLNHELTSRGAWLWKATRTSRSYRLFALEKTAPPPPKPGLMRVKQGEGASIDIEVWALPKEQVGTFIAGVASPLSIGTIETHEGLRVHGFLCEPWAVEGARDITQYGGWAAFLASHNP